MIDQTYDLVRSWRISIYLGLVWLFKDSGDSDLQLSVPSFSFCRIVKRSISLEALDFGHRFSITFIVYWRSLAHGSPGPGSNIPQIIYFADLINQNDSPPVLHTKYFGIILNRAYLVPRPWLMWHSCWLGHGVEYYKASCCQYCLLEVKMSRSVRRVFVKTAIIILRSSVLKVLFTQSPCQHEKDGNNRARLKLFF